MKYSTLTAHRENRFFRTVLQSSVSFCLALSVSIAHVESAQAAWRPGGGWGGGGWGGGWTKDTTAPTAPSKLSATVASTTPQINLSWAASYDKVGVKAYTVYRGSTKVAEVSGTSTSFSDTGLSASTAYTYYLTAKDAAGNTSGSSNSVSATTATSSGGGDGGSGGGGGGGGTGGTPGISGNPAGIYSIDNIVDKPYVDGVLVRVYWSEIEKTEGTYDFSKISSMIGKAEAAGQSITIATMAQAIPTWLKSKCQTFNSGNFGSVCVPWDSTMLTALGKLASAMSTYQVGGVALKDHPTVKQVDAPIGGIQSIRMTTLPSGYSASTFEEAVYTSVGYWANAFPTKHIYVGLFGVSDNVSNPSTAEKLRDGLLEKYNVNFFQEVLSGSAPNGELGNIIGAVKDQTGIMLQACGEWKNKSAWSWCNWASNDSPSAGFSNGFNNFNATYFEIYEADLLNSAYTSQFEEWHNTLSPYIP